jgi:hypothetical protein
MAANDFAAAHVTEFEAWHLAKQQKLTAPKAMTGQAVRQEAGG